MRFAFFCVFFLLWQSAPIFSQSHQTPLRFRSIGMEQGLSQSSVECILQDSFGFLWVGTQDGLNLYDGHEFRILKHDPRNPASLGANYVTCLLEDHKGQIWLGTDQAGISRYDRSTGHFAHFRRSPDNLRAPYSNSISTLYEDSEHQIWIGTRDAGISVLNPEKNSFTHYRSRFDEKNTLPGNAIRCIREDSNGLIWVGTEGHGIASINKKTGEIQRNIFYSTDSSSFMDRTIVAFLDNPEDSASIFAVGYSGRIFCITPKTRSYHEVFQRSTQAILKKNAIVVSALVDSRKILWLGTFASGLFTIDLNTGVISHHTNDPRERNSISFDFILTIQEDKNGYIWVGTDGAGLNFFNPRSVNVQNILQNPFLKNTLNDKDVWCLEEFENHLLIGTSNGGLNLLNQATGEMSYLLNVSDDPTTRWVKQILNIGNGEFWLATQNLGILVFDVKTKSIKSTIRHQPENKNSLSSDEVSALIRDKRGIYWIGTYTRGLNRYDPASGKWTHYRYSATKKTTIPSDEISCLWMSSDGRLYVGSSRGLAILDTTAGTFSRFENAQDDPNSISNNDVISFHEDKFGSIWIGTAGGLNVFNPLTKKFVWLDYNTGLINDVIYAILEDDHQNIWFSSNKGVTKMKIPTPEILWSNPGKALQMMRASLRNYEFHEGMSSDEFNAGACFRSGKSGRMYFGGINGISHFHPDQMTDNFFSPPVYISAISILGKKMPMIGHNPEEVLQLEHHENYLSFEFISLNFLNPIKTQFSYKLAGIDKDWVDADKRRFVSYANLEPGNYEFRVRVNSSNGLWSEQQGVLKFTITKPFWRRTWFYLGNFLFFGFLLWLVIFLRGRRLQRAKINLEKEVHERTRELFEAKEQAEKSMHAKEMFLSTMSHEIRTPLNAVIATTNLLLDESPREDQLENLETLKFSSDNLLLLINDILDFSKINAGKIEFEHIAFDIRQITGSIQRSFEPTASRKGLILLVDNDSRLPARLVGDPVRLGQILTNLIGNGIKFTEKGYVKLEVRLLEENLSEALVRFTVSDTGIGIAEAKQKIIFESFEQASKDTTRRFGGTGLGLTITKRLLELQNSEIMLESTPGKGSTFSFQLLFSKMSPLNPVNRTVRKSETSNPLQGRRILLVEDNQVNQMISRKFIEKWGGLIEVANDGLEGLEKVKSKAFDLILMDLQMPEMDGFETAQKIREMHDPYFKTIPIIALTAAALAEVREQVLNAGMNEYVSKPFNPEDLIFKILRLLNLHNESEQH